MPWWGWMIFGLIFLGSELLIVDAAFYLVFLGFAAIVVGALAAVGILLEPTMQWLVFSGIALVSMVGFRRRLYEKLRGSGANYGDGLAGSHIVLDHPLEPGKSCRQSFRGTDWTIINRGSTPIAAQTEVEIESTEGLTIIVSLDP